MRSPRFRALRSRSVVGLVLLGVALATAGCGDPGRSDSSDSQRGREQEPTPTAERKSPVVPAGSHEWHIMRDDSARAVWCRPDPDEEYGIEDDGGNCTAPAWKGTFDVSDDGTLTGAGKLTTEAHWQETPLIYENIVCTSGTGASTVTATQDVTVTGEAPDDGPAVMEFTFGTNIAFGGRTDPTCKKNEAFTGKSTRRTAVRGIEPFFAPGETVRATLKKSTGETGMRIGPQTYVLFW